MDHGSVSVIHLLHPHIAFLYGSLSGLMMILRSHLRYVQHAVDQVLDVLDHFPWNAPMKGLSERSSIQESRELPLPVMDQSADA